MTTQQNIRLYEPGEFICYQGEDSNEIFVLRSGSLSIFAVNDEGIIPQDRVESEGILVGQVNQPGAFFGEIGAILKEPRSASIRVSDDAPAQVMIINVLGNSFETTIMQNPKIGFALAATIAQRLATTASSVRKCDAIAIAAKSQIEKATTIFTDVISALEKTLANKEQENEHVNEAKSSILYEIGRLSTQFGSLPLDLFAVLETAFKQHTTLFKNRTAATAEQAGFIEAPIPEGPANPPVMHFEKGSIICRENSIDENMYILLGGRLEVLVGTRTIEIIKRKGDIFGENAMFGKLPRSSAIRALTDVHALPIPQAAVAAYLLKKPELIIHILRGFARRLPLLNETLVSSSRQMSQFVNLLGRSPEGCMTTIEDIVPKLAADAEIFTEDESIPIKRITDLKPEITAIFEKINNAYVELCAEIGIHTDAATEQAPTFDLLSLTTPKFDFVTKIEELSTLDSEHINFVINPQKDIFRACAAEFGHEALLKQCKFSDALWKDFIYGRIHNHEESFPRQFLTFSLDNAGKANHNKEYVLNALKYILARTQQEIAFLYKDGRCVEALYLPDIFGSENEELIDEATVTAVIDAFKKKPDDRANLEKLNSLYWDMVIATIAKKLPAVKDGTFQFADTELALLNYGLLDPSFLAKDSSVPAQIEEDKKFKAPANHKLDYIMLSDSLRDFYTETFGTKKAEKLQAAKDKAEKELTECTARIAALIKGRVDLVRNFPQGVTITPLIQSYDNIVKNNAQLDRKVKFGINISNEERAALVQIKTNKNTINTQLASFFTSIKGKVSEDKITQVRLLGEELEKRVIEEIDLKENLEKRILETRQHEQEMKSTSIKSKENAYRSEMIRLKKYGMLMAKKCNVDPFAVLVNTREVANKARVASVIDLFLSPEVDPQIFDPTFPRIKQFGNPKVMIVPGSGISVYDWEKHVFLIPLNAPKSLEESLANAFVEFHWDMDEDKSLRTSYGEINKEYKKLSITKLKQQLAKDYVIWATQESKGWKKLDKDVRDWFVVKIAKQQLEKTE